MTRVRVVDNSNSPYLDEVHRDLVKQFAEQAAGQGDCIITLNRPSDNRQFKVTVPRTIAVSTVKQAYCDVIVDPRNVNDLYYCNIFIQFD